MIQRCKRFITALALATLATAPTGCMTAFSAFQPENIGGPTIVITTIDVDGNSHKRVLSPIEEDDQLFVAANHWPRAWYHRALENPNVQVTRNGKTTNYRAVPVSEQEKKRLLDESGFPMIAYVFTGFAPRQFLRLDPR
ncbi:nitroreductase/quinone reductase family protein [Myxococcota bacterium]|nr:nitroreductase/quinone reductase family protein [Myxococcota bacterium]